MKAFGRTVSERSVPATRGTCYSGDAGPLSPAARKVQRKLHQTIRRITEDFGGRWHFNTSIAAIMELVNELYAYEDAVARGEQPAPAAMMADVQRDLVLMLAPFAPYVAAELWETLGETSEPAARSVAEVRSRAGEGRRSRDGRAGQRQDQERASPFPPTRTKQQIRETALADEKVKAAIAGKEIVKVLVVKGRLVNVVVK